MIGRFFSIRGRSQKIEGLKKNKSKEELLIRSVLLVVWFIYILVFTACERNNHDMEGVIDFEASKCEHKDNDYPGMSCISWNVDKENKINIKMMNISSFCQADWKAYTKKQEGIIELHFNE